MNSHLQRIREIEDELKIRFGKAKGASAAAGSWEFRSLTGPARAMVRRLGRRGHATSGGGNRHQQRVIVKASYRDHRGKGAGPLRAHINYLSYGFQIIRARPHASETDLESSTAWGERAI